MNHIVALSGGKDSTAMALRLAEVEPRDYIYICNPTGHELPDMLAHWARLEALLGKEILRVTNHDLDFWIDEYNALPNWRQRWCTRQLKIEPTIAFIKQNSPAVLYVGLRADEDTREGIYSDDVTNDFPFRRWQWGLAEVKECLARFGVTVPERTDCYDCYGQQLYEWWRLSKRWPWFFKRALDHEAQTSHTFRSPGRDTWPAPLKDLQTEFESGRYIRGSAKRNQLSLLNNDEYTGCRVCRL